jgi:hypothetical protein
MTRNLFLILEYQVTIMHFKMIFFHKNINFLFDYQRLSALKWGHLPRLGIFRDTGDILVLRDNNYL